MTTDPSIEREEAAGDAADLWTHQQGYAMTGTEWGAFEQGYLAGSAWARARLAAQEPTDAEVEAAARAIWAMRWATSWDEYSGGREPASPTGNDLRAVQMRRARAALSAARAARRDEGIR